MLTSTEAILNNLIARAADHVGGGLHQQFQLAAGICRRGDLEPASPNRAALTDVTTSSIPASHARVRLAVITNREGPGTYLSSSAQRRPVATQAHKSQVRCEEPVKIDLTL